MFENFSRRHLLDKPVYELKYEYVPPAFRLDVYKAVTEQFEDALSPSVREYVVYRHASISVNKEPVMKLYDTDDIEAYYNSQVFIDFLMELTWHEALSVLEFFVNNGHLGSKQANRLFEYHNVGYRVDEEGLWTEKKKVVVHYDGLIEATDQLLQEDIPYKPVVDLIRTAKKYLADPTEVNIANAVGAAVNAVEGYLKGFLEASNGKAPPTLGDCIKELRKKGMFPKSILNSLEELYIYRSRTENVGHGSHKYADLKTEDALLCIEMAVSFINYFHRKTGPKQAVK